MMVTLETIDLNLSITHEFHNFDFISQHDTDDIEVSIEQNVYTVTEVLDNQITI